MPVEHVAVVGAGIAGLTAALSLSRRGIACTLIEQSDRLAEVGAGLQISPNASRILARLGILPALERVWTEPDGITLRSGRRLEPIATVPVGAFARERWQAPYGVLHRATLQGALLDAVSREPLIRLLTGTRIESPSMDAIAAVCGERPGVIIGADGVWSVIRQRIGGDMAARFSGHVAWRMLVAEDTAPGFLDRQNVTAFLGPGSHLVAYPLRDCGSINLVAISTGRDPGKGWDHAQDSRTGLLHAFRNWNPEIRALLTTAALPRVWPLYEMPDGAWSNGRDTVLIGDAAHAVTPFAAQGAAMAIEDAYELALMLATHSPAEAFRLFCARRKPRVAKVRARGGFNRFVYHVGGPLAFGRDLVLKLRPPHSVAADFDWLYGYRAED